MKSERCKAGASLPNGFLLICNAQEEEAERKEHCETCHRHVDGTACKLYGCDDRRAEEGRAFCENIVDTEVFAGVFRRDDLGVIRARERLDGALEAADEERQNREVQETAEHERVQRDAEIARNTNENERDGVVFFRELCEDERAAERNDLRCEQEDDLTDRIEVQVCADIDGVIDDGAHAVYVQEEGDE